CAAGSHRRPYVRNQVHGESLFKLECHQTMESRILRVGCLGKYQRARFRCEFHQSDHFLSCCRVFVVGTKRECVVGTHLEVQDQQQHQSIRAIPARRVLSCRRARGEEELDRKSTRLNSSHVKISYAVFCLKKKKNVEKNTVRRI